MVTIAIISFIALALLMASSLVLSGYYIRQYIIQRKHNKVTQITTAYMMFFIGIFGYFLYECVYFITK